MSDETPDFGPSGYLPERASKRARKIVLRAPLGIQWVIASIVAGVVVVIAGVMFLSDADEPPGAPYTEWIASSELGAEMDEVNPTDGSAVFATATAGVKVFAVPPGADLAYCEESNRLESSDAVWNLNGRGYGVESLSTHPSIVHDGTIYVDWTTTVPGPAGTEDEAAPTCR